MFYANDNLIYFPYLPKLYSNASISFHHIIGDKENLSCSNVKDKFKVTIYANLQTSLILTIYFSSNCLSELSTTSRNVLEVNKSFLP